MRSKAQFYVLFAAVAILAAAALITALSGCGSSSSSPVGFPSPGLLGRHTTPPPQSSITSDCVLGYFDTADGMTFKPGATPSLHNPPGFEAFLNNGTSIARQVSWINVAVFFHGRKVGDQTSQSDTASMVNPAKAFPWSAQWVPLEGEAHVPLRIMNATNGNIENHPGFTCKVVSWGNAT